MISHNRSNMSKHFQQLCSNKQYSGSQWRSQEFSTGGGGGGVVIERSEVGIFFLKIRLSKWNFCTLNVMSRSRLCVVAQTSPFPFYSPINGVGGGGGGRMVPCALPFCYASAGTIDC